MKFTAASAIIVGVLATTTFATPTDFSKTSPRDLAAQLEGCGAAGSCQGPGGGELCNDRGRVLWMVVARLWLQVGKKDLI
ncbi:hypothetical protein FOXB_16664 [Fusarium oxysporum f. sp. conglutinans Fo5176]|uniref:Uncharacterized protein n=1 Tax=Fusarium oxysporum (strain Fo5176) TaxID=660025 RepID=F9GDD0_FUSOF|nr:hypothetical protein FOXB_16664 [Fusarium oxysporum f. sp. conglutinans Fo5176]